MTTKEFYRELDSILGLKRGTTSGGETLLDLSGWDSMGRLLFIQLADDLGVKVPPEALLKCQSTSDLMGLCGGRVAAE